MYYKGYKLHVKHLHPANSDKKARHNSKYLTICKVLTKHGNHVTTVTSQCSKQDTPSRKLGFELATSRAKCVVDYIINQL